MLALFLLAAIQFAPSSPETPNRQPQLASHGRRVGVVYGAGQTIYFAESLDAGRSFGTPVAVPARGQLALGMHRGPRLAYTREGVVVSAIVGEQGKGRDGDLLAWRSADGGRTWSEPVRVNDVAGAAREGLHAMTSDGEGALLAAWLDLRKEGMRVFAATSTDGGARWSVNRFVYESPSGSVCTCCHPSVAIDAAGGLFVMFRNALAGSRDLYLARSTDGGRTFEPARKLGAGTWKLEACPMDGGALAIDAAGRVTTVWRREETLYATEAAGPERMLAPGRNAAAAATRSGTHVVWTDGKAVMRKRPSAAAPEMIAPDGGFPAITAAGDGVVLAWEANGTIVVQAE
jgi:hypothetical protein